MTAAIIHHLDHSGVAIEVKEKFLIFDYFNDSPVGKERKIEQGVISSNDLKGNEGTYVFVSHRHQDHFNPVIFDWTDYNPDIKYILSSDLEEDGVEKHRGIFIDPDQEIVVDDLKINTYGSTDLGVSFLVETEGLKIFHAGDLNWWHWNSFSKSELKKEEEDFKKEVNKLKNKEIDIAFVPVDPRLEEFYYLAGEYFVREIQPEMLLPIHFGDRFEITKNFKDKMKDTPVKIAAIRNRGEIIKYP